jgi:outer membrane protein OmpA-like peptidoglycan-associated protein
MRRALPLLALLMLVASCKSPPKAPMADESKKRPVNSVAAIQLQSCRSDLQNARILMKDSAGSAGAARAADVWEEALAGAGHRNVVYSVLFTFGSVRVDVGDADATRVLAEARSAPLVLLRGRTDGISGSAAENRTAQERAAAVQEWLVKAGVEPARIRTTWQPVGDPAADNTLPGGRALNRRVEIEIYRAAPEIVALHPASEGAAHPSVQTKKTTNSGNNHGR